MRVTVLLLGLAALASATSYHGLVTTIAFNIKHAVIEYNLRSCITYTKFEGGDNTNLLPSAVTDQELTGISQRKIVGLT